MLNLMFNLSSSIMKLKKMKSEKIIINYNAFSGNDLTDSFKLRDH